MLYRLSKEITCKIYVLLCLIAYLINPMIFVCLRRSTVIFTTITLEHHLLTCCGFMTVVVEIIFAKSWFDKEHLLIHL
jgi:hypothetical protein